MQKTKVGVLMGGASAERNISLASGRMIAQHLPRDKYDVVLLDPLALMAGNPHISEAMRGEARQLLEQPSPANALPAGTASPESVDNKALIPATAILSGHASARGIQVFFLALHGMYGEDGTIQGMLELLGIPFVGSGTLASALAMDKAMAKKIFFAEGLPTPRGHLVERQAFVTHPEQAMAPLLAFLPAVVKPLRQGSSIGIALVNEAAELASALRTAFEYDDRVLVEERILGRELTVGVIGVESLQALPPIEIVPKRSFFDYQAKYDAKLADEICPAQVPEHITAEAQALAIRSHQALGCRGLSRTDFIWGADGLTILEVNTLPGLTENSLIPKAARAAGISFPELLDRLLQDALRT
jgi:D-alanine-D-alanine ligase